MMSIIVLTYKITNYLSHYTKYYVKMLRTKNSSQKQNKIMQKYY